MIAWFAAAALAADPNLCRGGFTNDELRVRVASSENSVITSELEIARRVVQRASDQLVCLEVPVAKEGLAGLAWLRGWIALADGDEPAATGWVSLARGVGGDEPPSFVPAGHRLRTLGAVPTPTGDGTPLAPKGGAVFLNGTFLATAAASDSVPGLVQVADETGRVVRSEWVEGALPADLVGPPSKPLKAPKWWTGEPMSTAPPLVVARGGGSVPLGRVLAAGGLAVAAGGAYGLAAASVAGMRDAASEDELAGARTRTNVLAVGSGVLAAGALGVGVTVWLSDGAGVGVHLPF